MGERCCLCNARTGNTSVCQKCNEKISCNPSAISTLVESCASIIQGIECKFSLDEAFLNFRSIINPPPLKFDKPEFTFIDASVVAQSETWICDCGWSVTLLATRKKLSIQTTASIPTPLKCVLWQCEGCEQFFLRKDGRLYKVKGISTVT